MRGIHDSAICAAPNGRRKHQEVDDAWDPFHLNPFSPSFLPRRPHQLPMGALPCWEGLLWLQTPRRRVVGH